MNLILKYSENFLDEHGFFVGEWASIEDRFSIPDKIDRYPDIFLNRLQLKGNGRINFILI